MLKRVNSNTIACPGEHHLPSSVTNRYNRFHLAARSSRRLALTLGVGVLVFVGFVWSRSIFSHRPPGTLLVSIRPVELIADGYSVASLRIEPQAGRSRAGAAKVTIVEGHHRATVGEVRETTSGWSARIRAGVTPGRVLLRVEAPEFEPATIEFATTIETADRRSDGTPDFVRLDGQHDRETFRRWFTFLAEAQYFQEPAARPVEINDCAALIRYAYREALRNHDNGWANSAHLPLIPALDSIDKYEYPHTPLGPALFRVRPGAFQPIDLGNGTFSQFADAQTLYRLNTHFVSRSLLRAAPGDLIFYKQASDHMPFHSMIVLGKSQIEKSGNTRYVIYHTGPTGKDPGEIRRLTLDELMHFPEPQWRPLETNPSFLGVFRWNILGGDE